jgi:uncharacterized membrane protein YfcA
LINVIGSRTLTDEDALIDSLSLSVLAGAALATSAFTAAVGLGGGVILLAIMLLYLEPLAAIPVHGVVQLLSNSTRTVVQWRHVRWNLLGPYALLLLPAAYLGLLAGRALAPDLATGAIGVFVLVATWAPGWLLLGARPDSLAPRPRFMALGGLVGFLSTTVGATGPLQGPFFVGLGLERQGVVGSFAACQTLSHMVKILVFASVGFAFAEHALLLALLCAMVIGGTWLGSQLLERIPEPWFRAIYKAVLTGIALRLVIWNGGQWLLS